MDVLRAVPYGAFLAWIVSLFMGTSGYRGGHLGIEALQFGDTVVLWSWPIFAIGTALAWALLAMQR